MRLHIEDLSSINRILAYHWMAGKILMSLRVFGDPDLAVLKEVTFNTWVQRVVEYTEDQTQPNGKKRW